MKKDNGQVEQAWWKFGHVWLVVSGPAVVVVASFVTLYLAIRIPDPVIKDDFLHAVSVGANGGRMLPGSLAEAEKARNHAATGKVPAPAEKP